MSEFAEQAEKLMVQRVQEIREEFGMDKSETYDQDMKDYVTRLTRILGSLPEEDREWLDNQMIDKFCVVEEECRKIYKEGFRDAMRLVMMVGI